MGKRLTYGTLARCRVVLVERLDGRRSCAEDSFVGHLGLHRDESLAVSILVCHLSHKCPIPISHYVIVLSTTTLCVSIIAF